MSLTMISARGAKGKNRLFIGAVFFYAACVIAATASALRSGSQSQLSVCLAAAIAPPVAYAALCWPLIVPFCLYVLLIPYDTLGKLGAFGSTTKLIGLFCAPALLLRLVVVRQPISPPRALFAWLAFLGWCVASLMWAVQVGDGAILVLTYASLIALYGILCITPVKDFELRAVLLATVLSGVFAAGYGVWLFHSAPDLVNIDKRLIIRFGENMIDPNIFSISLALPFAVTLGWLLTTRSNAFRLLLSVPLLLIPAAVGSSGSRGGATALAVICLWVIVRSQRRLLLSSAAIAGGIATLAAYPALFDRFAKTQSGEGAGRGDLIKVGIAAFRDHWFVGAGLGNFEYAFHAEFLKTYTSTIENWFAEHAVAHNVFLQVGVELGVVGLLLFAVALWYQAMAMRAVSPVSGIYRMRPFLEAAFAGLISASSVENLLNQKAVWLCFGLMVLLRSRMFTERRERERLWPVAQHDPYGKAF